MSPANRLCLAGFAATAIAFGPARIGYGLFLPAFRHSFELSVTLAGIIASAGLTGFLIALPVAAWMVSHFGARLPVLAGAVSATIGFAAVAAATGPALLFAGVLFASASAGLCWAPFNKAAEQTVPAHARPRILSIIASGTSIGIMLAAGLSLAVTYDLFAWPIAWTVFAAAGALTAAGLPFSVPSRPARSESEPAAGTPALLSPRVVPLYVAALFFGLTNAIYFSFAADRVVAAGGLPGLREGASASMIFLAYGACGLVGVFTGRAEAALGLTRLLRVIFAAAGVSLLLIAVAPTGWVAVLVSAGLQGAALMAISAAISFWSLRLFPGHGTRGFTAALVGLAVGSVVGPALAGAMSDGFGAATMFAVTSLPAIALAAWPHDWARARK